MASKAQPHHQQLLTQQNRNLVHNHQQPSYLPKKHASSIESMERGGVGNMGSGSRTSSNENVIANKVGTFPRVAQPANYYHKISQLRQDTSPTMRVTLDIWDQNIKNLNNQQRQQQLHESKVNEGKLNHYMNVSANTNNNVSQQSHRKVASQYQMRNQLQQNYHPLSQRTSQLNQQQPNKYEQMAQAYNLESLIKQAQQKKQINGLYGQEAQHQQLAFHNKIDGHFEGDNDHVDEEYESSPDKLSDREAQEEQLQQQQDQIAHGKTQQTRYEMKSPEGKDNQLDPSDYGMSSDSKYRLSLTPGCNLVTTERNADNNTDQQRESNQRIFSDLSAKVVNINHGGISALQNPFNNEQYQSKTLPIETSDSKNDQTQFDHHYTSNTANEVVVDKTFDLISGINPGSAGDHSKYNQHSEICNYDSLQPHLQQNPITTNLTNNAQNHSRAQSITPFDMLKNDYLRKKNEVITKYIKEEDASQDQMINQEVNQQQQEDEQVKLVASQNHQNVQGKEISESTEQFFNQIGGNVDFNHKKDDKKHQDKFLTFDDFLNRGSIQSLKDQNQKPENLDKQEKPEQKIDQIFKQQVPKAQTQKLTQEQRKKQEIEMLKQKAIQKEKLRQKRISSAIFIQKCVRGFLQRLHFKKLQINFKSMRKFRRMMSVAYYKYRQRIINQLITMVKQANENHRLMQDELYQKYLQHCVNLIQKTWKGYYSRRYVIQGIIAEYRQRRAFNAVVKGWKVRRILSGCREIIAIKRELNEIEQMFGQTKGPKDPMNKQIMQQRRKKIEELCRIVPNLYKNGRWVFSLQKRLAKFNSQRKVLQGSHMSQSSIEHQAFKQQQSRQMREQQFNQTLKYEGNRRINQQLEFNDYQSRDRTPQMTQRSQNHDLRPDSQINQNQQNNAQAVVWPSQRSVESVDSSVVMWPSQRQHPLQSTQKLDNEGNMTERFEATAEIQFTQRTAIADKIQTLEHNSIQPQQNKPLFKQQFEVQQQHFQSENSFDQSKIYAKQRSPQKSPIKKQFREDETSTAKFQTFNQSEQKLFESEYQNVSDD